MPAEEEQAPAPRRPGRGRPRGADSETKGEVAEQLAHPEAPDVAELEASPKPPSIPRTRRQRRAAPDAMVVPAPRPLREEAVADAPTKPLQTLKPDRFYPLLWRSGALSVAAIARREIVSLLVVPVGWILGAILILFASLLGFDSAIYVGAATMSPVFATVVILMLLFVPIYTMRLVAHERDSGTLEILLTSPVRDWEVVAGKWLGGLAFYVMSIVFTLVYLVVLFAFQPDRITVHPFGLSLQAASLDYGQILSDYFGLILAGSMFVAVGVLMSSLTRSQIIAAALSLAALLLLWNAGAAATFLRPPAAPAVVYLAAATHFNAFDKGAIALKDVVYFLSFTFGALYLSTRVLEGRKWA